MAPPSRSLYPRRSFTKNHDLLPASRPRLRTTGTGTTYDPIPHLPTYSLIGWTFGRGSVIWRIWPAVLLHTTFAAVVVTLSMKEVVSLDIPNVMLTVLGVVIGFVISYRASSGYDRYWLGRTCWSDVIRNARNMGRLIWFHVPPRLSPKTSQETASGKVERLPEELAKVMDEKRIALDLVEGFAVALKHHIRGELGIYYDDLYHLIRPLHKHGRTVENIDTGEEDGEDPTPKPTPSLPRTIRPLRTSSEPTIFPGPSTLLRPGVQSDPVIPPINVYGTFDQSIPTSTSNHHHHHHHHHHRRRSNSSTSLLSPTSDSSSSDSGSRSDFHSSRDVLLLPSALPSDNTFMARISSELIPFSGMANIVRGYFHRTVPLPSSLLEDAPPAPSNAQSRRIQSERQRHRWQEPLWMGSTYVRRLPKVAGGGENLPLDVLRCLSEWLSVLEDRGTVPGTTMGTMIGTIAAFEESLTALERILTTPLPFVYSVHISTVWLYLFFLPFQLITQFGYYTIPGVAIAAFIYLGFLAAGEEIEQPFGYDDNDLDLDLFCREIVHADIERLKTSRCLNAYFAPHPPPPRSGPRRPQPVKAVEDNGSDPSRLN